MQPISVVAPYLPTALHRRRDAARKQIGQIFSTVVAQRRANGARESDILQTLIDGRYKRVNGGRALTESEITGMLIAALFAGMHTSTITSSWTGIFLAAHRGAFDACVQEQRRLVQEHGEALSVEVLDKMEVLHACITEALRLHPPLIMLLRYARQAFEVTGTLLQPWRCRAHIAGHCRVALMQQHGCQGQALATSICTCSGCGFDPAQHAGDALTDPLHAQWLPSSAVHCHRTARSAVQTPRVAPLWCRKATSAARPPACSTAPRGCSATQRSLTTPASCLHVAKTSRQSSPS